MNKQYNVEKLSWISWILIVVAVLFASISLLPLIMEYSKYADFMDRGPISDTIGNIGNPFINIASVAMMFLAFYMQYRANKLVIKQFEHNQFESRFFRLLKMHNENSADVINEPFDGEGRSTTNSRRRFGYYLNMINTEYENWRAQLSDESVQEQEQGQGQETEDEDPREIFRRVWAENQDESFDQYYRQLFLLVRFVVSRDFLTYEQKRTYLRIVRSSLSSHEQILLYYNWLSGDGRKWEDENNKYFSDYRMIHNIDPDLITPDFDIRKTPPFDEFIECGNYMKEEKRTGDPMFEFERRIGSRESIVSHSL